MYVYHTELYVLYHTEPCGHAIYTPNTALTQKAGYLLLRKYMYVYHT